MGKPSGRAHVMVGGDAGAAVAAFVDEVVVAFAQRQKACEVGELVVDPFVEVVDFAVADWCAAAGHGAGAVHRVHGPPLRWSRQS